MLLKLVPSLHSSPLTLKLKDGKILRVRSFMTLYIFEEIFLTGVYDIEVNGVESIIDIGANTGLFVLRAKQRWPNANIVAFEPEPANYSALSETIQINRLQGVTLIQAAVSPERGFVTLYRHPRNIGAHSIVFKQSNDSVRVACQTISDALSLCPGGRCDLLKIDCEGAEGSIFFSLTPEIAARVRTIVYEPSEAYSSSEVNLRLEALGFTISADKGNFIARREVNIKRGVVPPRP
jgi:FkbM family methyltransferase